MRAGRLRHSIQLQRPDVQTDSFGGNVAGWITDSTVRAEVHQLEGKELHAAQQVDTEARYRVRIRPRPGQNPDATWRVLYHGRELELISVIDPDGLGRELLLYAKEHGT